MFELTSGAYVVYGTSHMVSSEKRVKKELCMFICVDLYS